jgi:hypothetical protein
MLVVLAATAPVPLGSIFAVVAVTVGQRFHPIAVTHGIVSASLDRVAGRILAQIAGVLSASALIVASGIGSPPAGASWPIEMAASFALVACLVAVASRRLRAALAVTSLLALGAIAGTVPLANPLATLGVSAIGTFAGLAPAPVGPVIGAQLVGALAAVVWLRRRAA